MAATCSRCGSDRIIPSLSITDRYGDVGAYGADAELRVHGKPEAWLFKDTVAGRLLADVCGECGQVTFRVENFRELYAKHLQSSPQ